MRLKKVCLGLGIAALFAIKPVSAISLGGTTVAKDKFVVYLLIGHSNMAGIDYAHSDPNSIPKGWNYPVKTKSWVLAKEPVNNKAAGLSGNGSAGPGMPFIKDMAAAYPDYYFGVISNASYSSTCRGENTGNNTSGLDPSDNRYWDSTYLYDQIITAAKAVQNDVTFGGVICMLGTVEATRTSATVCNAFSDDISSLAKFFRRDLGLPNLPFIMGEYEAGASGQFATTLPLPAIIQAQIKLIPGKLPYSATVNTVGITMLDDHHYTGDKGEPEFAKRVVDVIKTNNFFPTAGTGISISAPRRALEADGPWLRVEQGLMTLHSGDAEYRVNGSAYRHALLNGGSRARE